MDDYKELTCEICHKVLPNITRLRRHNSAHKQAFKREFGVTNVAKKSLNLPLPSSGKKCKECGRVFRHSMTLKRHERYHEKVRSQTCTECGMVFRSESYLLAHLLRSHRIYPSVRNDITIKVDQPSYHGTIGGISEIPDEIRLPKVIHCRISDPKNVVESETKPFPKIERLADKHCSSVKNKIDFESFPCLRGDSCQRFQNNLKIDYSLGLDIIAISVLFNLLLINVKNNLRLT